MSSTVDLSLRLGHHVIDDLLSRLDILNGTKHDLLKGII